MIETEILIEEYGIPEPKAEDYDSVDAYWAAHDAWLAGFSAWIQQKTAAEEAARIAEEEAQRQAEEEAAQRQREEEAAQTVLEQTQLDPTDRYPTGTYVEEFPLEGKPYAAGTYLDEAGNLWSVDGELLSPGTTPAMEPEELVGAAVGEPVTGEPTVDTALLLMDLLDALTGEDGMTGDLDGIQQVMDHPLMTTSFRDYTVTEGLLLLLLLSAFIAACARMLKGGFSWLR